MKRFLSAGRDMRWAFLHFGALTWIDTHARSASSGRLLALRCQVKQFGARGSLQ
jgi:hypothetical protein